jgi:hypothetical protein
MSRFRQKRSRNWARGILATFWILLAGVSGLYLFSTFSDPTLGGQLVKFTPASSETTSAVGGSRDKELSDIQASLRELTRQVAALSAALDPEQKNAAASTEDSKPDSASEPATPPASASTEPPEVAAAPASSPPSSSAPEAKPEEKPTEAPKPVATPEPEPKPIEQAAVEPQQPAQEAEAAPKPYEPPAVAVSPLEPPAEEEETPSGGMPAPSPPQAETEEAAEPEETPAAAAAPSPSTPEPTTPPPAIESAALDPIALPPAANDGSTRYGIEIGAVSKQDALRPLWREFLTNHAALVAGLQPRRVLAPDKKWRLIAGPFSSAAEASQACALFKKAARPCEATVYAGDGL